MKIAIYARVSSEKQAEKDLSISAQLKALRNYAQKQGWTIYKEFIDEAESARTDKRPAFQEMISHAKRKAKPFDVILVWKLSRFARNRQDSIVYKSLLKKQGVSVISMNEQVDDSPQGKFFEGMIEIMDEFYSLNLAEDTIRGLRENASRGFQNGSIPLGYKAKKVMDGSAERTKLTPEEIFSPIIQKIFKMYLEGSGLKKIVNSLNEEGLKTHYDKPWSTSTVSYILKNEVYTGTLVYGKKKSNNSCSHKALNTIRCENNHPAIVSKDTFDGVQKLLEKRCSKITHPREIASEYILSGILYCGKCRAKMIGSSAKSGKHAYYACHNYIKRGKVVCDAKLINKKKLEFLIVDRLKTHVITEENLKALFDIVLEEMNKGRVNLETQLNSIDKQLEALRGKLGNLYNSLETGKLSTDDIEPRIKERKAQIGTLEAKRSEIAEEIKNPMKLPFHLEDLENYVKDLVGLLRKGTVVEQKAFIQSFIKQIVVNHPKISIDYNIPIINKKGRTSQKEVLPIIQIGSPGTVNIRTFPYLL